MGTFEKALGKQWFPKRQIGGIAKRSLNPIENNISASAYKEDIKIITKLIGKAWFARRRIGPIAERSIKPMENQHFCIGEKGKHQNH